jgi:hypothetical protein
MRDEPKIGGLTGMHRITADKGTTAGRINLLQQLPAFIRFYPVNPCSNVF